MLTGGPPCRIMPTHTHDTAAKKGSIEDVAKLLKDYPQLVNDKGVCVCLCVLRVQSAVVIPV